MTLFKRPAFLRDVDTYAHQIAKDNPEAGRRFVDAVESTCQQLANHPEIGHQERFRKHVSIVQEVLA